MMEFSRNSPAQKPRIAVGEDHAGFQAKENLKHHLEGAGGVRAAVAHDAVTARMIREHNDANILTMGARVLSEHPMIEVAESFLDARFAGGRHQRRVDKISELDQEPKHKE